MQATKNEAIHPISEKSAAGGVYAGTLPLAELPKEGLLKHFKALTLHPKNAQELKGLILQLAVQGKLTAQWRKENPDVEPASLLLKRIAKEKTQLIKEKKAKKENLEPLKEDEYYFDIPSSWKWERLGNVGFIYNGDSVNKNLKEAKYANVKEGFPYIGTKDVGYIFDVINDDNGVIIPFDEPKFKIAKRDTVLICSEGGSAGKKMGIVNQDCCFGNKLYAFEQHGNLESVYILSLYGSASFGAAFKENMTGIIGGISRNTFASLLIPIPPLEEQKAIVATVNTLFKEVEQLEQLTQKRVQLKTDFVTSALQALSQAAEQDTVSQWAFLQEHFSAFFTEKANIKKLRESILQLAVQGKLTRKWRQGHPELVSGSHSAQALLERIKAEKAQLVKDKKIKKEKPLPSIAEEEIPYELPEGWIWCRMGKVTDIQRGSSPRPKGDPMYFSESETNNHWISIKDISKHSKNNVLLDTEEYLTDLGTKYSRFVNKNELIVAVSGSTTGKCCLTGIEGYFYDGIAMVRLIGEYIDHQYHLMFYLQQYSQMNDAKFGAAFPNINTKFLSEMMFPFPPEEEQKAIVEKVNALMALCDRLEQEIETHQSTQEDWMRSCLREVFEEK